MFIRIRWSPLSIALFAVCSTLMLCFLVVGGVDSVRLWWRSQWFTAVDGRIESITVTDVQPNPNNATVVRQVNITFSYSHSGTRYTSDRITLDQHRSLRGPHVSYWTSRYKQGDRVTVWVDASDTAVVLLDRRLTFGATLWIVMLICAASGSIVYVADAVDAIVWRSRRLLPGVRAVPQAAGWVLRVHAYPPSMHAALVVVACSVVMAVVTVVLNLTHGPFMETWLLVCICTAPLAFGVGDYFLQRSSLLRGNRDLIVDTAMRTLTIPPGFKRETPMAIEFSAVQDVETVAWEQVVATQHGTFTYYSFAPTIVYRTPMGGWKNAHLVEWRDEGKADALCSWLRKVVQSSK